MTIVVTYLLISSLVLALYFVSSALSTSYASNSPGKTELCVCVCVCCLLSLFEFCALFGCTRFELGWFSSECPFHVLRATVVHLFLLDM